MARKKQFKNNFLGNLLRNICKFSSALNEFLNNRNGNFWN